MRNELSDISVDIMQNYIDELRDFIRLPSIANSTIIAWTRNFFYKKLKIEKNDQDIKLLIRRAKKMLEGVPTTSRDFHNFIHEVSGFKHDTAIIMFDTRVKHTMHVPFIGCGTGLDPIDETIGKIIIMDATHNASPGIDMKLCPMNIIDPDNTICPAIFALIKKKKQEV